MNRKLISVRNLELEGSIATSFSKTEECLLLGTSTDIKKVIEKGGQYHQYFYLINKKYSTATRILVPDPSTPPEEQLSSENVVKAKILVEGDQTVGNKGIMLIAHFLGPRNDLNGLYLYFGELCSPQSSKKSPESLSMPDNAPIEAVRIGAWGQLFDFDAEVFETRKAVLIAEAMGTHPLNRVWRSLKFQAY